VTTKMRWISVLLALTLVLVVLPLGAYAQGGPGKGNPPPGQTKPKGGEGDSGDGAAATNNGQQGNNDQQTNNGQQDNKNLQGNNNQQANNGQQGTSEQVRAVNIRGKRFIGLPIINREGKKIGEVSDVLVDMDGQRQSAAADRPASGGPIRSGWANYVLARSGGTLGLGGEVVPVPLTALRLHLVDGQRLGIDNNMLYFDGTAPGDDALKVRRDFYNQNALVLVSDLQDLSQAPQVDLNGFSRMTDPSWDQNLRGYWSGLGAALPQAPALNGAAYRVSSVRTLDQYAVHELGGSGLGWIDDVLLTLGLANPTQAPLAAGTASGNPVASATPTDANRANIAASALSAALPIVGAQVNYALVGHGGWWGIGANYTPVPVSLLTMDRDYNQKTVYMEADKSLLDGSPSLDNNQANELNDGNYFQRVRAYWQDAGFGPFDQ
jgi:hypothetical protein